MSRSPIIELREVTKTYPTDPDRKVLDGINFTIEPGDQFALVGPSGSGKSTLLNLLGTLDGPTRGEVLLEGESTSTMEESELAAKRGQLIGFIFQLHHLLPQCTTLENVLVPVVATRDPDWPGAEERARELLGRVGLEGFESKYPSQLSGGERQRVAVIRALINRPQVILADEPTGALDEGNATRLIDLLLEISESENVALVMVTHDGEAAARLPKIHELRAGRVHVQ